MSSAKWKKTENPNTDWIGEKILGEEDKLMEQLRKAKFDAPPPAPDTATVDTPLPADGPLPDPVPRDREAERRAYADLLAHFNTPDDGDADTLVEALTLDDYDKADFQPYPASPDNPEA